MRKLLILDCDGVLYPPENISHDDFVAALSAIKENFFENISAESAEKIKSGADIWNELWNICEKDEKKFENFCKKIIDHVDYSKIRKSKALFSLMTYSCNFFDIVIFSDNHKRHIEKVLQQRFGMGISDFKKLGIKCYDVTSSKKENSLRLKRERSVLVDFCESHRRKVRDCIFVDNNQKNISAARDAGLETIYICKKRTLQSVLKSLIISAEKD